MTVKNYIKGALICRMLPPPKEGAWTTLSGLDNQLCSKIFHAHYYVGDFLPYQNLYDVFYVGCVIIMWTDSVWEISYHFGKSFLSAAWWEKGEWELAYQAN